MAQEGKTGSEYVKKETMLVVAVVAVAAGFLAGIVFSAFNSGPDGSRQASAPPGQSAPPASFTNEQATRIMALEKEVAANPGNLSAWTQLGNVYFDTAKYAKAIRAYEKSLGLNPNDPNVWTDLGVMYRRDGQPEKALDAFGRAIALDPSHQPSRFNRGIVLYYDFKDREGAIRAWEELLALNPSAMAPDGQPLRAFVDSL